MSCCKEAKDSYKAIPVSDLFWIVLLLPLIVKSLSMTTHQLKLYLPEGGGGESINKQLQDFEKGHFGSGAPLL